MQRWKIPGLILLIIAHAALGALMIFSMVNDDIPTLKSTITFIALAVVLFGIAAFFVWRLILAIRGSTRK